MQFYNELFDRAGLSERKSLLTGLVIGLFTAVYAAVLIFFRIPGFALAVAGIFLLFAIETLRQLGQRRQEKLLSAFPVIFESIAQGISTGSTLEQLFEKLAANGPLATRRYFQRLSQKVLEGTPLEQALEGFRSENSNRLADLFCELVAISKYFGITGQKDGWESLAKKSRTEQGTLAMIRAKQDWVIGTAKFALMSPWLVAALLMQLPQNRIVFESDTGSAVLVLGLALSGFAYFLVNHLGRLPITPRIFYALS